MKIKVQLIALVAGVAIPLILLAGFVSVQLWQQVRQSYQQQFLERANAVRLALDTEFDVTLRTLRTMGDASEIPALEFEVVLQRRFRRLLDNYPDWAAVSLTDQQGRVILTNARPGDAPVPLLDLAAIRQTMLSEKGFVSDVRSAGSGRHVVFVAVSISRDGVTQGVIYVVVEHTHWLDMLSAYPVSKRGVLTLMDRRSKVITRTINDRQWVGQSAPAEFWASTKDLPSGAFKATGLDGASYYAAFSRSGVSGWVLSTGVPQEEVDDALYWQNLAMLTVASAAILGALLSAWKLGKDINLSMRGLLDSAGRVGDNQIRQARTLPIREAQAVENALLVAHGQLLVREASLSASLEREAVARRQAESGNRAKDQFLAMMGHELRNPLSAITVAVDLLEAATVPQAAQIRSRDIIRRQARHLTGMIDNLMDVAQLDLGEIALRTTRLDLAQISANVLARFEETGRCAHLQMRTEHVPAWVEADEARLELLLTCLLDNACKYTPAGGIVTLVISGEADSSGLRIRDTGVGIAPQVVTSLFDPFSQGQRGIERSEGGLGLGLALARRLVTLHGGTIAATSDGVGHGATFTVTFPKAEAPPPAAAHATPVVRRDLLLTIVEDIADNREMLTLLLEAQGRRINSAADGPSGLALILQGPSDVAVVDIGLPGFDGMEVARRVRMAPGGDQVLLIALTGYGTEADRAKALAAGFDELLTKPFDFECFEAALATALASKGSRASQS